MAKKAFQHQGAQLNDTLYYPSDLLSNNSYGFYILFFIYIREPVKEINAYQIRNNKVVFGSGGADNLVNPSQDTSHLDGPSSSRKSNTSPSPSSNKSFYQAEVEAAGSNPHHRSVRNDLNAASGRKWHVLKQSIALPIVTFPENIRHNWTADELGFSGFLFKRGVELFKDKHEFQASNAVSEIDAWAGTLTTNQLGSVNSVVDAFTKGAKHLARKLGDQVGLDATTVFNRSINAAENPQLETAFTSTGPRGANFEFSFYPRNREEAINVYKIMRTFKFYAAPHFHNQGKGFYQDYPSEFSMAFMYRSHEGTYITKWGRFVIAGINHALKEFPDNLFHPDNNNAMPDDSFIHNPTMSIVPTKIDLSLEITELEIMDKERVTQGY